MTPTPCSRPHPAALLALAALAGAMLACGGGPAGRAPGTRDGRVRWVGRVIVDRADPNVGAFQWQGAGLVATVRGAELAVRIHHEWGSAQVWFQPVIDGKVLPRLRVDPSVSGKELVVARGLAEGEHRVELYRDTEWIQGPTRFLGFSRGTVVGAPPATGRRIEVVGDSISAGYGNLGKAGCRNTPQDSSWYASYGAIAGRALGAEVSTVAWSGAGLYRDYQNHTAADRSAVLMGRHYPLALGPTDTRWTFREAPQAVVVNLGTNDMGPGFDPDAYEAAGKALLRQIRAHAPDAWILLAAQGGDYFAPVREAQADLVAIAARQGDRRVAALAFDAGLDFSGCDGHPSAAAHQRMSGALEAVLRAKLGW